MWPMANERPQNKFHREGTNIQTHIYTYIATVSENLKVGAKPRASGGSGCGSRTDSYFLAVLGLVLKDFFSTGPDLVYLD